MTDGAEESEAEEDTEAAEATEAAPVDAETTLSEAGAGEDPVAESANGDEASEES